MVGLQKVGFQMAGSIAVLGLNCAHDAAACLLVGGRLVAAIAEERLSRVKHHTGFPHRAIEYCLLVGGLRSVDDVDLVVLNKYQHSDLAADFRKIGLAGQPIVNPSHHLLHAYYAWVASGFADAAILIVDGSGYGYGDYVRRGHGMLGAAPPFSEMEEAESRYVVSGGRLDVVHKSWALWEAVRPLFRFPSLGHMYSAASQYIFGRWEHAGKTMGLAPYGDQRAFPDPFIELLDDGLRIDTSWATGLPPRSAAPAHLDRVSRDLAAKVQAELERAMLHLCDVLHAETGMTRLCISGGVGLNSVANGRIVRESPFSELFVTPAAGDAGVAIGAALYGHHRLAGGVPQWQYPNDYHGRAYRESEIRAAIDERGSLLRHEPIDADVADVAGIADRAAEDIAAGRVVGWFEGGSEFGPRALGHRSILADPRSKDMKDRLNETVKYREPFRPYAASVLAAHVAEYFDIAIHDPFMLVVADVRPERAETIPSLCHVDGTCRIQTVRPDLGGRFRRLIERFFELTTIPMVLNTSFNIRGEPIVETPGDAIDCFLSCNIDVLYLEGHRLTKARLADADTPGTLIPRLNPGLSLSTTVRSNGGAAMEPEHHAITRSGYRAPISPYELALLQSIDGCATIDAIAHAAGTSSFTGDAHSTFADLQLRGLVSFIQVQHEGVSGVDNAASQSSGRAPR